MTDESETERPPECNCSANGHLNPDKHHYGCLWRTWQTAQERKRLAEIKRRHPFDWRYDPTYSRRRRGSY